MYQLDGSQEETRPIIQFTKHQSLKLKTKSLNSKKLKEAKITIEALETTGSWRIL